ncbi:hypothetical protein FVE85_1743 [Porphyridium purpureum]|uniref:Calcineurin-like phosphoesterase domain-containing protein n=1 Tax=Porphyridium purpureum TaxID=35688 RepID=A0A5J4YWR9_PORPP|nr:hypothetical protein FVE85_1743 [Porphyridium purpureum]|eukprot:POR0427..scf209_3
MGALFVGAPALCATACRAPRRTHCSVARMCDVKHDAAGTKAVVVLGDLHLHPEAPRMAPFHTARQEILRALADLGVQQSDAFLVSVGDLGAYGIAGTSASFELARDFLRSFGLSYSVVTGNHDLEGLDEFKTDQENLDAWGRVFGPDTDTLTTLTEGLPVFRREIPGSDIVLLGMSTVRFREARGSSHEVYIDDEQLSWFDAQLAKCEMEGKRAFVFTHAPPMGAGLRSLQSVHVKNMCAWLNHSSGRRRRRIFLQKVKQHPCLRLWASGHFHLSHEFEDSVTLVEGRACFLQCGVIGPESSRDGYRQTRIILTDPSLGDSMKMYSVNHHDGGSLRLDASVVGQDSTAVSFALEHYPHDHVGKESWFRTFTPRPDDGCVLEPVQGEDVAAARADKVCWWHTSSGSVLGVHDGMVIEYDEETLAPVGLVMTAEELAGRDVFWISEADALVINPPAEGLSVEVLHPNADGTFARQYQLNKRYRIETKRREQLARQWLTTHRKELEA